MKHLQQLTAKYPELQVCVPDIERAFGILVRCFREGGKLLICGNGGSASDSDHIVGELMKSFSLKRPVPEDFGNRIISLFPDHADQLIFGLQGALPAISLVSQTALFTAFINDVDPELVFAQQVYGYGKSKDVLLGISSSGNSRNVLHALRVAKAMEMRAIGLTGQTGGGMQALSDVTIRVPFTDTPTVQERHLPVYHALCLMLEEEFFTQ